MTTAMGALIGQGILRSLQLSDTDFRLVGLDRKSNAYGASLCDSCYQKPCLETDPDYLPWLKAVIEKENIQLILPGIEEDVFFFHDHRTEMADWPVRVVLNSPAALAAGRDKWSLHQDLVHHQLPTIPTVKLGEWEDMRSQLGEPPMMIKAMQGSGSRGQRILHNESEWQQHRHLFDSGFLAQKLVGTDEEEYTVGLFGYGDGASSDIFTFRRQLWSGGTWQAEVVESDGALIDFCTALTKIFKPLGPTNYQFRKDGEQWFLLEINPRFSASTAIRAGFGFNEAKLCVDHYLHNEARPNPTDLKRGSCQRFVTEHFDFE